MNENLKNLLICMTLIASVCCASCAGLKTKSPHHALRVYAAMGDLKKVKSALADGADINSSNAFGIERFGPNQGDVVWASDTALITAIRHGRVEVVKFLISAGANFDLRNARGESPLMVAAEIGNREIVNLLLTAHALVNTVTDYSMTALSFAINKNHQEIVDMLLEAGAGIKGKATDTVVMRQKPSATADRVSCQRWTQMCETGPCGEETFSTLKWGDVVWLHERGKKEKIGKWYDHWYKINVDSATCPADVWVYGAFLKITD